MHHVAGKAGMHHVAGKAGMHHVAVVEGPAGLSMRWVTKLAFRNTEQHWFSFEDGTVGCQQRVLTVPKPRKASQNLCVLG